MIVLSVLVFLFLFSVLIIVHEFGHFYMARKSGVKVEEFALGMGKKLWSFTKGEVEYRINAIPFGGYVKMVGEEEESTDPRSFNKASLPKRMAITLAGVFMNFVLAIVLLTFLFSAGTSPIIISQQDFDQAVEKGIITLSEENEEGAQTVVDIQEVQVPFPQSIGFATMESFRLSKAIVHRVGQLPLEMIRDKKVPDDIAGPLGIAEATHQILPQGFKAVLKLLALLSLSLGVMNLLPIPALDGGRFLFQIVELITFRKPPERWENAIHLGGFMVLMLLMVVITWSDIVRIFF